MRWTRSANHSVCYNCMYKLRNIFKHKRYNTEIDIVMFVCTAHALNRKYSYHRYCYKLKCGDVFGRHIFRKITNTHYRVKKISNDVLS